MQLGSSHGSLQSAAATRQQGDVDPEIVHPDAASKAAPACRRCDADDDGHLDGEQMHMWGLDEKPGKVEVDEWQVSKQAGKWPTLHAILRFDSRMQALCVRGVATVHSFDTRGHPQSLVSLWDRLDGNVVMHEAPSCLEVSSPDCEGWVTLRTKGRIVKRYAIRNRSHPSRFAPILSH